MFRVGVRLFVLLFSLIVLVAPVHATQASNGSRASDVRLPGHILPALARAAKVASAKAESNEAITLTIVLRRDDQAGFERYLRERELHDPLSPNLLHYLTQPQIADRFGPSQDRYDSVMRYLRAHGFQVIEGSQNHLTISVKGTRAQAAGAFDVHIDNYSIGARTFFANDRDPALPADIAPYVQAVQGLSNLARPKAVTDDCKGTECIRKGCSEGAYSYGQHVHDEYLSFGFTLEEAVCRAITSTAWSYMNCLSDNGLTDPSQASHTDFEGALAKDVADCGGPAPPGKAKPQIAKPQGNRPAAIDGTGQTVGLVEFDSFVQSDVANFLALVGFPSLISNLSKVDVNGGVTPGAHQDEVLLDINAILTVSPGAKVVVYDAPFTGAGTSFQTVLQKMVQDKVTIISNSWAYCEDQTSAADVQSIDSIFQNAAMAGISVFNGAGDSGGTCLDGSPNTISVPADSPNATAVGARRSPPDRGTPTRARRGGMAAAAHLRPGKVVSD